MIRRILYSPVVTFVLHSFCRLFYSDLYLSGKFFQEKRMGYCWAIKSIPRLYSLRRRGVKFPVGKYTNILGGENIFFHPSSLNVFQQFGCYYQGFGHISIGKDCWIGQNTGIITANHDVNNIEKHSEAQGVVLGDSVWIGMNSLILPGVKLGDHTVVGGGSVVTKSFPDGYCVIAGNPEKKIKDINHNSDAKG